MVLELRVGKSPNTLSSVLNCSKTRSLREPTKECSATNSPPMGSGLWHALCVMSKTESFELTACGSIP